MKKILLIMLSFTVILSVSKAQDQKSTKDTFTGVIEYSITITSEGEIDANMQSQLPKNVKMTYGKDKVKSFQTTSMYTTTNISMNEDGKCMNYVFIEMMGQKYKTKIEKQEAVENNITIEEFPEDTKEIEGYKCYKIIVKSEVDGMVIEALQYVCKDLLRPECDPEYTVKTPYIPLYTETTVQGMNIHQTATKINKSKVKDKEFDMLEGYQEVPPEMLGQ